MKVVLTLSILVLVFNGCELQKQQSAGSVALKSNRGRTRFTQTPEYSQVLDIAKPTRSSSEIVRVSRRKNITSSTEKSIDSFNVKPVSRDRVSTPQSLRNGKETNSRQQYQVEEVLDDLPQQTNTEYRTKQTVENMARQEAFIMSQRVFQQANTRKQNYERVPSVAPTRSSARPEVKRSRLVNRRQKITPAASSSSNRSAQIQKAQERIIEVTENEPDFATPVFSASFYSSEFNKHKNQGDYVRTGPSLFSLEDENSRILLRTGRRSNGSPINHADFIKLDNSKQSQSIPEYITKSTQSILRQQPEKINTNFGKEFNVTEKEFLRLNPGRESFREIAKTEKKETESEVVAEANIAYTHTDKEFKDRAKNIINDPQNAQLVPDYLSSFTDEKFVIPQDKHLSNEELAKLTNLRQRPNERTYPRTIKRETPIRSRGKSRYSGINSQLVDESNEKISESDNYPEPFKALIQQKEKIKLMELQTKRRENQMEASNEKITTFAPISTSKFSPGSRFVSRQRTTTQPTESTTRTTSIVKPTRKTYRSFSTQKSVDSTESTTYKVRSRFRTSKPNNLPTESNIATTFSPTTFNYRSTSSKSFDSKRNTPSYRTVDRIPKITSFNNRTRGIYPPKKSISTTPVVTTEEISTPVYKRRQTKKPLNSEIEIHSTLVKPTYTSRVRNDLGRTGNSKDNNKNSVYIPTVPPIHAKPQRNNISQTRIAKDSNNVEILTVIPPVINNILSDNLLSDNASTTDKISHQIFNTSNEKTTEKVFIITPEKITTTTEDFSKFTIPTIKSTKVSSTEAATTTNTKTISTQTSTLRSTTQKTSTLRSSIFRSIANTRLTTVNIPTTESILNLEYPSRPSFLASLLTIFNNPRDTNSKPKNTAKSIPISNINNNSEPIETTKSYSSVTVNIPVSTNPSLILNSTNTSSSTFSSISDLILALNVSDSKNEIVNSEAPTTISWSTENSFNNKSTLFSTTTSIPTTLQLSNQKSSTEVNPTFSVFDSNSVTSTFTDSKSTTTILPTLTTPFTLSTTIQETLPDTSATVSTLPKTSLLTTFPTTSHQPSTVITTQATIPSTNPATIFSTNSFQSQASAPIYSSTTPKIKTTFPTAWAPDNYIPRFSSRPSISNIRTVSPTTQRNDEYVVFGILSNNTVVRKTVKPSASPQTNSFIIYGIFPNNTIVRKYPNGTIVPDDNSEIEIVGLSTNNLTETIGSFNNERKSGDNEKSSTSSDNRTHDNVQDNLIDTVPYSEKGTVKTPRASTTHILSLTTTKSPNTTPIKDDFFNEEDDIFGKTTTENVVLPPISFTNWNSVQNELSTRSPKVLTSSISVPIVEMTKNEDISTIPIDDSLPDNEFLSKLYSTPKKTTTVRQLTSPITSTTSNKPPSTTHSTESTLSTSSTTRHTTEQSTTKKNPPIVQTTRETTTTIKYTTPTISTTATVRRIPSTVQTTQRLTSTVKYTTPTISSTATVQRKPTTVKYIETSTLKNEIFDTTFLDFTTEITTTRPRKTTQAIPKKKTQTINNDLLNELAFLNSLRVASTEITQKPSNNQEELANRIIALAVERAGLTTKLPPTVKNVKVGEDITLKSVTTDKKNLINENILDNIKVISSSARPGGNTNGISNEALLAALLREQGIEPQTPHNANKLAKQLQLPQQNNILNQLGGLPRPASRPARPTAPPARPFLIILDGLREIRNAFVDTFLASGPRTQSRRPVPTTTSSSFDDDDDFFADAKLEFEEEEKTTKEKKQSNAIPTERIKPSQVKPTKSVFVEPENVRGGRSQLIDAAINVTKAFSQFIGAAIQGAAQSFQSLLVSGSQYRRGP